MATNQQNKFKDPRLVIAWLETALRAEQKKYEQCPVLRDMEPGHEAAQAWGYVVAGYFLLEESFKALLYLRAKQVPTKHSLTTLFDLFEPDDQDVLREYYSDYRATIGGHIASFPFTTLDKFLENLDGDPNPHGTDHIGSFDWRYFLIEENRSQDMPFVSIDYLHEVAYGCIQIAEYARNGKTNPRQNTHSGRMHSLREAKYNAWLMVRMNSDGGVELSDRLEILWGPDYRGRHDFLLFKEGSAELCFSELPAACQLPIDDKRAELEEFDEEEGYKSVGIIGIN